PTLVAVVLQRVDYAEGTAYGTMFAIGSLGSLMFVPVAGVLARRRKVQGTLRFLLVIALALAAAALVFALVLYSKPLQPRHRLFERSQTEFLHEGHEETRS